MAAGSYYKKCSIQFCKRCKFKAARAQGLICKFVLDQRFDFEEKNHALECLEDYLDDGGLVHGYDNLRNDDVILYSLNKHKRWMLLDYINELVEREEVKDDEFRLVLHERSAAPPSKRHVILEPELLEELKEHTLAYHDSKCTNHHIYPSGYFSTVTDLSLKCYTHTVNHSSGPQQKLQKFQHESVIRGDVHPVAVPEIRYEITDPDFVIGPCKCDSKKGFIHRCTTKVKRFGWKKKGNHNKSWSRWYYQGLDHMEHKRYRTGYYDNNYHLTDTLWPRAHSNEGIFQSDSPKDENQPRNFTFKDFLCSGNSNSLKKPKKDFKKKKRIPRQKDVEKIPYTTIKRPVPKKQYDIDTRKSEIKKEVSIVNVGTKQTLKTKPKRNDIHYDIKPLGKDFNKSFCSCMVNKDSIEEVRTQPKGLQVHIANCVPQQLRLCVTGETTQAYLLFWQKSEWSKWSTEAEYWLKILLKPFTKGQLLLPIFLREELAGKPGHVYKVLELVDIAQRVVNLATAKKGLSVKPRLESVKFEPGQLTARVSRARVDIQTVQEAYKTLSGGNQHILYEDEKQMLETTLNSDVGLLESYELLPSSLTQTMDFGFCKSCLHNFDPPLLNGCVLLPCLHYYCVPCWRKYIWERIQNRCSSVSCQDDTCDEVVDEVMIQTLLPCQLYNHWLHSRAEGAVAQSPQWHHCPKQSCDLVAKVTKVGFSHGNVPVACGCDRVWCWSCEAEAHWPVTCTQYSTYRESLSDLSQSCRNKEILSQGPDTDIHTIDQYNSYLLHSTVQYKVLCNEHRSAWTTQLHNIKSSLWKKVILKRERFGSRRNLKKMNRYAKNSSSLEKLESCLHFLQDVHFIMECICLLLSKLTKKTQPLKVRLLLQQLYFGISTLTKMFNQKRLDDNDVLRMLRSQSNIEDTLKFLAVFIPGLQGRNVPPLQKSKGQKLKRKITQSQRRTYALAKQNPCSPVKLETGSFVHQKTDSLVQKRLNTPEVKDVTTKTEEDISGLQKDSCLIEDNAPWPQETTIPLQEPSVPSLPEENFQVQNKADSVSQGRSDTVLVDSYVPESQHASELQEEYVINGSELQENNVSELQENVQTLHWRIIPLQLKGSDVPSPQRKNFQTLRRRNVPVLQRRSLPEPQEKDGSGLEIRNVPLSLHLSHVPLGLSEKDAPFLQRKEVTSLQRKTVPILRKPVLLKRNIPTLQQMEDPLLPENNIPALPDRSTLKHSMLPALKPRKLPRLTKKLPPLKQRHLPPQKLMTSSSIKTDDIFNHKN